MDDDWLQAVVVVHGRIRSVDPIGLLADAESVAEATIAYAESHLPHFHYVQPGWYIYEDHAMLVAPLPRVHAGVGDEQHFLFARFQDAGSIDAMKWAAQAPVHRGSTAGAGGASGLPETPLAALCHNEVAGFWPEEEWVAPPESGVWQHVRR